jgi:hypothetical protein
MEEDSFDELHRELLEAHARLELRWPIRLETIVIHLSFAHYVCLSAFYFEFFRRWIASDAVGPVAYHICSSLRASDIDEYVQ